MHGGRIEIPAAPVRADALGPDDALAAACRRPGCGAETVLDRVLAGSASLDRLADNLRCACGARGGLIAVRPLGGPRPPTARGLYLFLA